MSTPTLPLHRAAAEGDKHTIKLLLDGGADVNYPQDRGETALMFAVAREQPKAARLLLRRGALVNAATHDGVTPLHMAAHCITDDEDAAAMARMLLDEGADVHAVTQHGTQSPLHYACGQYNFRKTVQVLLDGGARAEMIGQIGDTGRTGDAGEVAVATGVAENLATLIANGYGVNRRSDDALLRQAIETGSLPVIDVVQGAYLRAGMRVPEDVVAEARRHEPSWGGNFLARLSGQV